MLIHLFLQVSVSSLDVTRKNSLPRSQILLVRGNNVIDGGESGSVNSVNEANRVFADATVYPNPTTDYFWFLDSKQIPFGRDDWLIFQEALCAI